MVPETEITSQTEVVWESDKEASSCHDCKRGFTLFIRRHHCRRCGLIFCSDCSFHSISLPNLGFREAVRVCSPCFRIELERRNSRGSMPRASIDTAPVHNQRRSNHSSRESSDNEELEKYKEIIKEQQKAIETLMKEMDLTPNDLEILLQNPQNISKRQRSSSTPQVNQQTNITNSTSQEIPSRLKDESQSGLRFSQSLREGNTSRMKGPLPQFQQQTEQWTTPLPFDEEIAETIVAMGYSKSTVISHLLTMAQKGLPINLPNAIDYVVSYQGKEALESYQSPNRPSVHENQLKEQLKETEKKLIESQEKMLQLQKEEEIKQEEILELKQQIQMLERLRIEKDTQIEILTGGFGFGTFLKVHGGVDIMEDSECIICMDRPKNYKTSCGCKVLCSDCYKILKKKECPNCGKKIK